MHVVRNYFEGARKYGFFGPKTNDCLSVCFRMVLIVLNPKNIFKQTINIHFTNIFPLKMSIDDPSRICPKQKINVCMLNPSPVGRG